MIFGYHTDGTVGVDKYDAKAIGDGPLALNSTIDNTDYIIQGRGAFDASDIVAWNFRAATAGTYTIAKDHANGLFATVQEVNLVDVATGTENNLQTDAYAFTTAAGVDNARFSLKYQKTLGVTTAAFNDNSVQVYRNNGVLNVASGVNTIRGIKVFDILGRVLAEQNNVNATTATIKM